MSCWNVALKGHARSTHLEPDTPLVTYTTILQRYKFLVHAFICRCCSYCSAASIANCQCSLINSTSAPSPSFPCRRRNPTPLTSCPITTFAAATLLTTLSQHNTKFNVFAPAPSATSLAATSLCYRQVPHPPQSGGAPPQPFPPRKVPASSYAE